VAAAILYSSLSLLGEQIISFDIFT